MDGPFLAFPFAIDGRGRTATTDPAQHLRDLIEQLLFTDPGERVNRPTFGCGVRRLVFMPNSGALAAATRTLVRAALQADLSTDVIVDDVQAVAEEEVLTVTVVYTERVSGNRGVVQVTRP
jgi:phage baseplate assembly protein W